MKWEVNILNLSKLKYSFSEAKKNVTRNGLMSVASLFTIASCLVILGVFAILSVNVNSITEQVKDQCEIQLYINTDATEERVAQIGQEIEKIENVKEVTLFTKQQTLDYAINDMDKEDVLCICGSLYLAGKIRNYLKNYIDK